MQAWFICLAHNLMVLQEHRLSSEEGITNTSEIKRKAKRLSDSIKLLTEKKRGAASAPAGLPALHPTQCKIHPLAPCLPLCRSSLADRGGRPEGILCPFLKKLNYTVPRRRKAPSICGTFASRRFLDAQYPASKLHKMKATLLALEQFT